MASIKSTGGRDPDDRLLQRDPSRGPYWGGDVLRGATVRDTLLLCIGLNRFREEFEGEGVKAFNDLLDISLGRMGVTINSVT